jgi:hypothetical protein
MAAALQTPIIEQGKKNAVRLGTAAYGDQTGLAFGYARRVGQDFQVSVDAATTTDAKEGIVRAGVNYSW